MGNKKHLTVKNVLSILHGLRLVSEEESRQVLARAEAQTARLSVHQ